MESFSEIHYNSVVDSTGKGTREAPSLRITYSLLKKKSEKLAEIIDMSIEVRFTHVCELRVYETYEANNEIMVLFSPYTFILFMLFITLLNMNRFTYGNSPKFQWK